ncbi:MAG: hypothetical protein ACREIC_19040 [Limisphaerales bacterium]
MQPSLNALMILAIFAYVCIRRSKGLEAVTSEQLSWWQKLAGIIALFCVVLIAANPEFWALGLLGDTTFFDLFVLLLSIQFQMTLLWALGFCGTIFSRLLRWIITPRPRRSYLLTAWTIGVVVNGVYVAYLALRRWATRSGIRPFGVNLYA